jgi:hypothetical protein
VRILIGVTVWVIIEACLVLPLPLAISGLDCRWAEATGQSCSSRRLSSGRAIHTRATRHTGSAQAPTASFQPLAIQTAVSNNSFRLFKTMAGVAGCRGAARRDLLCSRVRSQCRFAPPRNHLIPDARNDSAPLFLKRQCDRAELCRPGLRRRAVHLAASPASARRGETYAGSRGFA